MNKHVEPEQEDKSYQLYSDGTMLVKVDGVLQRRNYETLQGLAGEEVIEPQTYDGEVVARDASGDVWIVTTDKPTVLLETANLHPLARLAHGIEELMEAHKFNTRSLSSTEVHQRLYALQMIVVALTQEELAKEGNATVTQTLNVEIDACAAAHYINKAMVRATSRYESGLAGSLAIGWAAHLDAPLARDMGRSKFNAGAKAAIDAMLAHMIKEPF